MRSYYTIPKSIWRTKQHKLLLVLNVVDESYWRILVSYIFKTFGYCIVVFHDSDTKYILSSEKTPPAVFRSTLIHLVTHLTVGRRCKTNVMASVWSSLRCEDQAWSLWISSFDSTALRWMTLFMSSCWKQRQNIKHRLLGNSDFIFFKHF